jgi:hypothetical protein
MQLAELFVTCRMNETAFGSEERHDLLLRDRLTKGDGL